MNSKRPLFLNLLWLLLMAGSWLSLPAAHAQSRAVRFANGTRIKVPTNVADSALNFTTDAFTLEAWVNVRDIGPGGGGILYFLTDAYSMNPGAGYSFGIGYDKIGFEFYSGANYQIIAADNLTLPQQKWHHVAVSKAAGVVHLYLDGDLVHTDTLAGNFNIALSPSPLRIGFSNNSGNLLDEVKIWSGFRNAQQIRADQAEICSGPYPADLLAYYQLNESSTTVSSIIACANNALLNAMADGPVESVAGASGLPISTTTLYVDSAHVPGSGCGAQGISWSTAFPDLDQALEAAQFYPEVERIYVAKGTYYPGHYPYEMQDNRRGTERTDLTGHAKKTFHIREGLEVYGGYPSGGDTVASPSVYRTVLDGSRVNGIAGDSASTVVYFNRTLSHPVTDTSLISGFTIRNSSGLEISNGGGVFCDVNAICRIEHCYITGCHCANPGSGVGVHGYASMAYDTIAYNERSGIHSYTATMHVDHCFIGYNGGNGAFGNGNEVSITSNEIAYNGAYGIMDDSDSCVIADNYIHHNGEIGIYLMPHLYLDTTYIIHNVITDHNSDQGASGLYLLGGPQVIVNNVIMRDTGRTHGGGIYAHGGYK